MSRYDKFPSRLPSEALEFHEFEERQALTLLRRSEPLVIFTIIFTVVISQFWFITFIKIFQTLLNNDNPEWWQNLILAIIMTLTYAVIIILILRIPITIFI